MSEYRVIEGDCLNVLATLDAESVQTCITSPPYYGLRDYGHEGQIGLEETPEQYVAKLVDVFREVRRVLRGDGTLWLNLGDSYGTGAGRNDTDEANLARRASTFATGTGAGTGPRDFTPRSNPYKPKDLLGIPWMVAFALRQPYYTGRIRDERDRIWLAAMIDAEGCMFIHKRKVGQSNGQGYVRKNDSYGSGLEVSNTSRAVVERCMAIAGAGSICEQTAGRRQTLYRWNLRSNECREIVREVYPYLVAKQHEARLLCGCPSSGERAEAAHEALKLLHNGGSTTVDCAAPAGMTEPGYYLRSDVIWSKLNPMPESVTDRPTKAHEYLFLLSKSARYFYDADAVREDYSPATESFNRMKANFTKERTTKVLAEYTGKKLGRAENSQSGLYEGGGAAMNPLGRNKRSVWIVATQPFPGAHFATFPPRLIEPCVLAGSRPGDTVLDPFNGAGTTGVVALRHDRDYVGIELNSEYAQMARDRIYDDGPLLNVENAA